MTARPKATAPETIVQITKPTGMMTRSASLSGESENATLLNKRAGVNSDTLSLFKIYAGHQRPEQPSIKL